MEILTFARELAQSGAERLASYRVGQTLLRQLDRGLWVVEKCARWAVPPPLDADSPQPELVRPLPWVFFLALLVALRIARESISLVNLVLGKPPLRSIDVVTYIQSKRRYLRTLKYQGNRLIRARTSSAQTREPWYRRIQALFEFTMCFRRSNAYGNNNTTHHSHNDEVLVVKRSKHRDPASPVATTSETTMERLIEKMMVDLDADSDDDSSFTLTNATSVRSESVSECEDETLTVPDDTLITTKSDDTKEDPLENNITEGAVASSTFEENSHFQNQTDSEGTIASSTPKKTENETSYRINVTITPPENHEIANETNEHEVMNKSDPIEPTEHENKDEIVSNDDSALGESQSPKVLSPKEASKNFLQNEKCSPPKTQQSPKNTKIGRKIANAFSKILNKNTQHIEPIANGRLHSAHSKKKGTQRRDPEINAKQFI